MINYKLQHVNGLFFELLSDEGKNREYDVTFVDRKDNKTIYNIKLNKKKFFKTNTILSFCL